MEMGWRAELGVKDLTMAFTGFIAEFDKRLVAIKLTLEERRISAPKAEQAAISKGLERIKAFWSAKKFDEAGSRSRSSREPRASRRQNCVGRIQRI